VFVAMMVMMVPVASRMPPQHSAPALGIQHDFPADPVINRP